MSKQAVLQGTNITIGYKKGKNVYPVHQQLNFQLYRGELSMLGYLIVFLEYLVEFVGKNILTVVIGRIVYYNGKRHYYH